MIGKYATFSMQRGKEIYIYMYIFVLFFFPPLERSCHFLTLHVEVNTVFPYHVLCSATPGMGLGVYSVTESDLFQFNCF